mgnify:CR=1 FL=1
MTAIFDAQNVKSWYDWGRAGEAWGGRGGEERKNYPRCEMGVVSSDVSGRVKRGQALISSACKASSNSSSKYLISLLKKKTCFIGIITLLSTNRL